ncbi:MAG: transglutaminase-like domain-containing protein [Culturomica sp.]|jgi:hypothetical protein|nr:transglutaminase-like domain-containing protein [Culturomica sp.]
MKRILIIAFLTVFGVALVAQTPPIVEEHFLKKNTTITELLESYNESLDKADNEEKLRATNQMLDDFKRLSESDQKKYATFLGHLYYNQACYLALTKQKKAAVEAFAMSINNGYNNYQHANTDSDLNSLRKDKTFISLMKQLQEKSDFIYILRTYGAYSSEPAPDTLPKFEYQKQEESRGLTLVKSYFKIDTIVGDGNDLSKVLKLLHWVHNNIRHNGGNFATCEFDAIDIYNYNKTTGKGVNCRHLAITLNEMLLSIGIPSRYVTCLPRDINDGDCHVINSVWVESLGKWIWVDPTFDAYVKDENGNFLGIGEVRERLIKGDSLVLNADANWNNEQLQTKEYYLDSYMAKNLFCLDVPLKSQFNTESQYGNNIRVDYVTLRPVGYEENYGGGKHEKYNTYNPDYFWQKP